MTYRKCGLVAVFLCATAAGCWQVKAPAPPVPEGGPLPPGAVARLGDSQFATRIGSPAFSADGKYLAGFGLSDVLTVWDTVTGKPLDGFAGVRLGRGDVAWSPDGKLLALANKDKGISFLDSKTGKEIFRLDDGGNTALPSKFTFSPDSKTIVGRCDDDFIRLVDLTTKKEIRKWPAVGDYLHFVFTPDGKTLISGGGGIATVIDLATGKEVVRFESESPFNVLAVSPDGKTLAVGGDSGVRLYDLSRGKEAFGRDTEHPGKNITSLCFSADGKTLASASMDLICVVWDLMAEKVQRQFPLTIYERAAFGACYPVFAPDGKTVAWTCHADDRIHLTDIASGAELHPANEKLLPRRFALTPDGKYVAAPCSDGKLRLWNALSGKLVRAFDQDARSLGALDFSGDGKRLVGVGRTNATIWDVETGKAIRQVGIEVDGANDLTTALSWDGKILAVRECSTEMLSTKHVVSEVRCVDVETGKTVRRTALDQSSISNLAFAPDGKTLAFFDMGFSVYLMEVGTGKRLAVVDCPPDQRPPFQPWFTSKIVLAYATDGKVLLAGQGSHIVLRAPDSGQEIHSFAIPADRDFFAFSPDGRFIAWTNKENTVLITDIRNEARIAELKGHEGKVESVVFSADGKRVATGSSDGTILIWDLARCPKPADK